MVATRPITIEEFETLPLEGPLGADRWGSRSMTPSADESSSIGATILGLLWSHVRPRGLGRLYSSDGGFVLFPRPPHGPARSGRRVCELKKEMPQGEGTQGVSLASAPDLVVEVLSPSDRASEVLAKLESTGRRVCR